MRVLSEFSLSIQSARTNLQIFGSVLSENRGQHIPIIKTTNSVLDSWHFHGVSPNYLEKMERSFSLPQHHYLSLLPNLATLMLTYLIRV
jgi:hypothetical protein